LPAQLHSLLAKLELLPANAWWTIAIILGLLLLSGGRKKKKKKEGGGFVALLVLGGLLVAAGGGGAAAPVITHAIEGGGQYSALGQRMASSYGWGSGSEWNCLDDLWTRESGWRMVWNTQGSGAYGIPQSLPASKMASAGADYMTNPRTQIRWGLRYIKSTYQTPCGAWAHETSNNWYLSSPGSFKP
jgi:hypothetical protein